MIEVVSLGISVFSLVMSGFAVFLAARNQEVHIYHEDADQSLS